MNLNPFYHCYQETSFKNVVKYEKMKKEKKTSVVSGVSWSFAEKILTEIMSSVISILLARILLPEDYGLVGLAQIAISIMLVFVNTGLGTSVIQNKDADEEQISTVFYLNVFLGILIYALLFLFAPLIAKIYKNESITEIIRLLALRVPISSIYNIQHAYIKKRMEFKKFFFASLLGTVVAGIIGVVMAYHNYGIWALVYSNLIDLLMDSIILYFSTGWFPKFKINIGKTKTMLSFGSKILFTELVTNIYGHLRSLVIGLKYSKEDLAFNSKGQKFSLMAVEIANSSLNRVILPTLSNLQDEKSKMKEMASKIVQISTFIMAPLLLGIGATARSFVPLLLTERWIKCIPYIWIYCITYLMNPLLSMNVQIVQACGEGDKYFKHQVYCSFVEITIIALALLLFNDPIYVALSIIPSTLFSILLYARTCEQLVGYGLIRQIKDISYPVISSTVMAAIVLLINVLKINILLKLIIQVAAGVIVYGVIALIVKPDPVKYLLNYLKQNIKTS